MQAVVTLLRREVAAFFDSLIAYVVLGVFLVSAGLFFWVLPGNVLETRGASLDILFSIAPWLFLFLVPALTMRSFAEEFKTGTLELLSTQPISDWQILLGKYLAAVTLVLLALLPTLVYYLSIRSLGETPGNIDDGATWGAYLGLAGIGAVFAAIGVFSSTLTNSQIVAFLLAAFLCFSLYAAFDFLAELSGLGTLQDVFMGLSVAEHYRSISRGVLDTRDLAYYASAIGVFLFLAKTVLTARKA